MKLSVILTAYTNEKIISRSIEAIAAQTLPEDQYELVVIDDASTDTTYEVLQALSQKHTMVLLRNETNRGSAYSRNKAADQAKNELLVFIQDDIIVERDFLEKHLTAHTALDDEKAAVAGYTYWHPDLEKTPFMEYLDEGQQFDFARFNTIPKDKHGLIRGDHLLFYTSNLSLRASFFKSVGGFDETFMAPGIAAYDDTELAWRLHKVGMQVYFAPDAKAGHLHQRTLESLCKRKYAEGFLSWQLAKKHPDFTWGSKTSSFWYNLSHLKFGALFASVRPLFILLTTIVVNPLTIKLLEPLARKMQYKKNVPILFKAVLGYYFNKGYWAGFLKKGTIHA